MPSPIHPELGTIRWRTHIHRPPEKVYDLIAADKGRATLWVEKTIESGDMIHWPFGPGLEGPMKVFERSRPHRFVCEFLDDSKLTFELRSDGKGGTDLTRTNSGLPEKDIEDMTPGWVGILMNLKSVADHSPDVRNHDPRRTGEHGYVEP